MLPETGRRLKEVALQSIERLGGESPCPLIGLREAEMYWTYTRSVVTLLLGLSGLMLVGKVQALTFAAEMDQVSWQVDSSPFACRLRQSIPGFGEAVFERAAGDNQSFYLKSTAAPLKPGSARLVSRAPQWAGNRQEVNLGYVPVSASPQPVQLDGRLAERLLMELYMGMAPTFSRTSAAGDDVVVDVVVSGINFRKVYAQYQGCFAQLLPYSYRQLAASEFRFEPAEVALSAEAQKRLDQIVQYLQLSPDPISVQIDGYADVRGRIADNMQLAQERAAVIAEYLLDKGIAGDRITINHHGERQKPGKRSMASKATLKLQK